MSKALVPLTLPAIQSRFNVWHGAALQSVAHLKIAKFFCGLEVAALAELHQARPGRKAEAEADHSPFEEVVQDALGVTARTARRYRSFFDAVGKDAPKLAERLNGLWRKFCADKALPNAGECGTLATSQFSAADLVDLCSMADDMGLSELFAKPEKEAAEGEAEGDNAASNRKAQKEKLLRFWGREVAAALQRREYLRLPIESRRVMADEMEKAAKALKASLSNAKGGAAK
jgi:hypothetical protein